jgi:ABC-2 type transport system ATP-binding protein
MQMSRAAVDPAIDVRGISKYYGPFVAVEDVSFSVAANQVVALLGPNGAGKTTMMRILTGYLTASAGSAAVCGVDVADDRLGTASAIGYLPENGPLYLDMTPVEALRFFGEARGITGSDLGDRIDAVAAQCDIVAILDKPIGKLSKGLRQRVGMAQTLLHDPPVLVLDEPTAGLDPVQIRHFRSHLRQLAARKTVLVSTHILPEIEAIADRVLVIVKGRLVFDGTSDDVARRGTLEQLFDALTTQSDRAPAVATAAGINRDVRS